MLSSNRVYVIERNMDPGSGRGEQLGLKYKMKEARFVYYQNTEVFLVTVCGIELLELKHAEFFFL